jgi:hypothetical protein
VMRFQNTPISSERDDPEATRIFAVHYLRLLFD